MRGDVVFILLLVCVLITRVKVRTSGGYRVILSRKFPIRFTLKPYHDTLRVVSKRIERIEVIEKKESKLIMIHFDTDRTDRNYFSIHFDPPRKVARDTSIQIERIEITFRFTSIQLEKLHDTLRFDPKNIRIHFESTRITS